MLKINNKIRVLSVIRPYILKEVKNQKVGFFFALEVSEKGLGRVKTLLAFYSRKIQFWLGGYSAEEYQN